MNLWKSSYFRMSSSLKAICCFHAYSFLIIMYVSVLCTTLQLLLFPNSKYLRLFISSLLRCSSSSLPSGISSLQFSSTRCFSERPTVRDHPKRPLSAYIRYFMDQHVILHKQHPDLKRTDITRKIGQEWKALPDFVKEVSIRFTIK
ncbi:hypothetical protein FKM82_021606 [Ascaphus truei]